VKRIQQRRMAPLCGARILLGPTHRGEAVRIETIGSQPWRARVTAPTQHQGGGAKEGHRQRSDPASTKAAGRDRQKTQFPPPPPGYPAKRPPHHREFAVQSGRCGMVHRACLAGLTRSARSLRRASVAASGGPQAGHRPDPINQGRAAAPAQPATASGHCKRPAIEQTAPEHFETW